MNKLYFDKKRWFLLLYFPVYLIWFFYLEQRPVSNYHMIGSLLDLYIPFCEYFVIPYFLWFAYIGFAFLAFIFEEDGKDYYRMCINLFIGMTIFLIVSTVYPNCQVLRPTTFAHDNIFVTLTKFLYSIDSATNLFPSIHVFNSVGIYIAVQKSNRYAEVKYRYIKVICFIMTILIIAATLFLKQHSIFDVVTAFIMQAVLYPFIYGKRTEEITERVTS